MTPPPYISELKRWVKEWTGSEKINLVPIFSEIGADMWYIRDMPLNVFVYIPRELVPDEWLDSNNVSVLLAPERSEQYPDRMEVIV